ncbi:MAG: pitrilysin family protein [Bacillota bacterium]|nr:pitrilysin family protein [Bacillota bacterium]
MKNYIDLVNEELYINEVNGLKIYIMPKKKYKKKTAMLTVKYGANHIKFSVGLGEMKDYPLGIAHFLEHKLFEEKEGNIFNEFAILGTSPNAYTNSNVTCYHFTCTDFFQKNLELLIKFVFHPYFNEENVKKEREIIEQEIIMYNDNPSFRTYINALGLMYEKHPVKNDVAGTIESIKEITPELLYECYHAFYTPQNMVLVITGDVNVEEVLSLCDRLIPRSNGKQAATKYIFLDNSSISKYEVKEQMNISIPNFVISYKDRLLSTSKKEMFLRKLCGDMLIHTLFSKSSRLYNDLYSSGLINDTFEYEYVHEHDYSFFICDGESNNPSRVAEEITKSVDYFRKHGLEREDFNRSKKVLLGYYISRFNSIEALSSFLNDIAVNEIDISFYYELLKKIKIEDLNRTLGEIFTDNGCVLSVVE